MCSESTQAEPKRLLEEPMFWMWLVVGMMSPLIVMPLIKRLDVVKLAALDRACADKVARDALMLFAMELDSDVIDAARATSTLERETVLSASVTNELDSVETTLDSALKLVSGV